MASTAESILTSAWNLLRKEGGSTDVPALQETSMLTFLSQANLEWARAHRRGGGAQPIVFYRETGFDLVSDTNINQTADVATTDTSFVVDESADIGETKHGALVIWDDEMHDICEFTGNTVATDTITGVTGLAFTHEDGDTVQVLYKLPSNFSKFRPSEDYLDGVQMNGMPMRFMQGPPQPGYFSMYENGTSKWLWLPKGSTGKASVLYEKVSTTIDSTDDTVDVPSEFDFFLVWRVVQLASIPADGGQPTNLYAVARDNANKILREALMDRNVGRYVRVRQFSIKPSYDPNLFKNGR